MTLNDNDDRYPCPLCKENIKKGAILCPFCRSDLSNTKTNKQGISVRKKKNRSLAIFLAIILGGIGAHKFYLEEPGWGILYLLFCWTFIPAILGILEGIIYLTIPDESFYSGERSMSDSCHIRRL